MHEKVHATPPIGTLFKSIYPTATRTRSENRLNANTLNPTDFEPFVDADTAAEFLSTNRREVLKLTRQGVITGFPISGRLRKTYKYRLSLIAEEMTAIANAAQRVSHSGHSTASMKVCESYA